MKSILFVCLGNICRSPAGEGVMQYIVEQRGCSEVKVDSAGTAGYHQGDRADPRMRDAASRRGYDLQSRARQAKPEDLRQFDLVIAMDRSNQRNLLELGESDGNVKLLSNFLSDDWPIDVPDPYYGGSEGFETVLDMLEAACPVILDELLGDTRDDR